MLTRLLLVPLLLLSSHGLLQAESVDGKVRSVNGDAVIVTPGSKPKTVTNGTVIPPGSKIFTKDNANLIIQWLPGAYSVMFPNSSVAVGALNYSNPDGVSPNRKVSLGLLKGSVFSHLAHNDGTSNFQVRTPSGVAAARGTDWVVGFDGKRVKVSTLADTVLCILPSGRVITVDVLFDYLMGDPDPTRFKEPGFEKILNELKAAGLSITLQNINITSTPPFPGTHTDGYVVTWSPADGDGFQFFIPLRIGNRDDLFPQRPLEEQPIESSKFPTIPPASP
jgi:hypothetical protein